ncbi:acyl transferase, partial [Streptomyces sp. V4-01]|nr:acyl transferase [Streptomyces sp. V4-01]
MIVEQAPEEDRDQAAEGIPAGGEGTGGEGTGAVPWVLSARSPQALREQAARLADWSEDPAHAGVSAAAVAHRLAFGRARLTHRAVVVGEGRAALLSGLRALAQDGDSPALIRGTSSSTGRGPGSGREGIRPVFVFPGQG